MTTSPEPQKGGQSSDPSGRIEGSADDLDALVQRASTPSLASLFKAGKERGLIKPGKEYGNA